MTGYLTTQGRWKAGLLRICSGAGGGVRMCEHFCVRAPVPETEILDSTSHMFGLWVQILMEHRIFSFCIPFTFILIGAQHICNASSVKEYPGNLRVQGIIFEIF